ncbi:MAG: hypothetical protein RLZZ546_2866 [Bacteroidota bacterium]|jgi:hemoglobin/transferrin/lactoferrin receptor protein
MKINITILLIALMYLKTMSQDNAVDSNQINLNQVVISANKTSEKLSKVSSSMAIIGQAQIKMLQAQSTADLLQNTGNVFVQKSQQGGGSPVLRGFEANKVLIVIDGVRMNNAIYRGGHLQNVITMDNFSLSNVEILFGPASIVYGSDALGGVMHFYTKKAQFKTDKSVKASYGNMAMRSGTVNNEKTIHFDLNLGKRNIASYSSVTASDFGDLKMGKKINPSLGRTFGVREVFAARIQGKDSIVKNENIYLQKFSGFKQLDIVQKISHKLNNNTTHGLNIQLSTSTDVPRYDRLTDKSATTILNQAEWYYGPQKRLMIAYELENQDNEKPASYRLGVHYQKIEESRHNRRMNSNRLNSRIEKLDILGLNYDWVKKLKTHDLRFGLEIQHNDLHSSAFTTQVETGEIGKLDTRYPDGENSFTSIGAYVTHSKKFTNKFTLNDGFRLGYASLNSNFIDKSFFPFPFSNVSQKNMVYSGSVGLIYNPNESSKIGCSLGTGYRVPNIDDLGKVFESSQTSIIVPNADLKPEKTISAEVNSIFAPFKNFQLHAALYYTWLQDAIVVGPYTFNGASIIDYNGNKATVFASQNNAKAKLYGFSLGLNGSINNSISVNFTSSYTKGIINDESNTPLDHIPPFLCRFAINYQSDKFKTTFYAMYNGWKKIEDYNPNGEDNQQYAPEEGMPSWYTINLRASYRIHKIIEILAGVENILDLQYRAFASGINGGGRNLSLTALLKF